MKTQDPGDVTRLLHDWRRGDSGALNRLTQLVHDELHRIAHGFMRGERRGHTLQTTALVNEAYVRLVGADVPIKDRNHFKSLAATAMRRILVDNARGHGAAKRGHKPVRVTLDEAMAVSSNPPEDLIDLDNALDDLARQDARKAHVVELFFFGGLTRGEIADLLEVSEPTVARDLRMARAWLRSELARQGSHETR